MNPQGGKKYEIYGAETLYREVGYYISGLELYEKALKYFDKALECTPDDKRALRGRSRARAKECEYVGAMEDINKALKSDPNDLITLADKALNTFLSCEFEEALLQNERLVPLRQLPDDFVAGIMHCHGTIERCVKEIAGEPLRDHFPIIRKIAWKKYHEAHSPFEPRARNNLNKKNKHVVNTKEPIIPLSQKSDKFTMCDREHVTDDGKCLTIKESLHSAKTEDNRIPPYVQPFLFKPLQNYTTNIENYMAEKYLDAMYLDKIFLKELQTRPGTVCPNVKGSDKILKLAKIGFKRVAYKQELLRSRRPFYYIKYREAKSSGALKLRQEQELKEHQQTTKKEADVLLLKIYEAFKERKILVLLDLVEKMKAYCDSKPRRLLLDKDMFLEEIYRVVRRAFYELNRLNKNQFVWDQEKRIYIAFGFPISREPSRDSVIGQFKNVYIDHKKLVKLFERRLKEAVSQEEICWCYHELTRNLVELKRFELARVYGRKCVQEGHKCNLEWVINGSLLLATINIRQHNKSDARNEIVNALKIAQTLNDPTLEEYLNRCLTVIEKIGFDDAGSKVLEKREQVIVGMMASSRMKEEVKHLFRMMSVMPSSRRMLIMPGVRIETPKAAPGGRKFSTASIGGRSREQRDSIDSGVSRFSTPRTKTKKREPQSRALPRGQASGVGFMELIKYHLVSRMNIFAGNEFQEK